MLTVNISCCRPALWWASWISIWLASHFVPFLLDCICSDAFLCHMLLGSYLTRPRRRKLFSCHMFLSAKSPEKAQESYWAKAYNSENYIKQTRCNEFISRSKIRMTSSAWLLPQLFPRGWVAGDPQAYCTERSAGCKLFLFARLVFFQVTSS